MVLKSPRPGLREETHITTWYGRSRFQTFAVSTSCSSRRLDVLVLLTSWRLVSADVLTSCSCRRLDVLFLSPSWRCIPVIVFVVFTSRSCRRLDALTSCSCRRPDVAFLSPSSSSWRQASLSWHRAPRLPPVPAVIIDVLSSSSIRRTLDFNSSSSHSLSAFRSRDALVVRLAHSCRLAVFIALTINRPLWKWIDDMLIALIERNFVYIYIYNLSVYSWSVISLLYFLLFFSFNKWLLATYICLFKCSTRYIYIYIYI